MTQENLCKLILNLAEKLKKHKGDAVMYGKFLENLVTETKSVSFIDIDHLRRYAETHDGVEDMAEDFITTANILEGCENG